MYEETIHKERVFKKKNSHILYDVWRILLFKKKKNQKIKKLKNSKNAEYRSSNNKQ